MDASPTEWEIVTAAQSHAERMQNARLEFLDHVANARQRDTGSDSGLVGGPTAQLPGDNGSGGPATGEAIED